MSKENSVVKAVVIEKFGGPEAMKLVDVPVPEPGPAEVRVKVEAVGLNYSDIMIRQGMYIDKMPLPYGLGREFAGTVDKAGEGVKNLQPGQRVAGTTFGGALAEYVTAPASNLSPVPPGMTAEQGASILIQGITAVHCLDDCAQLKSGETVLIHAAAGGVGTLAVQIALARGARVIGTASNAEKCTLIDKLGAKAVDYTKGDWVAEVKAATNGKGADVILESVGGSVFTRSFHEALAIFGRMVVYGVASGEIESISNREILQSNKTIVGYYLGSYFPKYQDRAGAAAMKLVQLIGQGKVQPVIGKTFSLDQSVEAFNHMQQRKSVGKVIVKP
jgi:NADPH2:quinone reductase